jgi:hypothetical protein
MDVQNAAFPVEIPFAGRVEFFEEVIDVEPLALLDAVKGGLAGADYSLFGIERGDIDRLVGPVKLPVSVKEGVGRSGPATHPLAVFPDREAVRWIGALVFRNVSR